MTYFFPFPNIDQLRQDLKATYRTRYHDVRHVQLDPTEHYNVNTFFVDGNIQSFRINKLKSKHMWEDTPYHTILSSENMKGSVVIIEGEVGLGKSILALKFLADWCEKKTESPLSNVEILICLSASQLVQHSGIHQAIEDVLLPVGSRLSGDEVFNILHNSHSILLLLEDVEEVHCKHDTVLNILRRKQLPSWKVAITTRSFHFVQNIAISYKRFRLIYFNKTVRENYIRKAGKEKRKYFLRNGQKYSRPMC